MTASVFLSHTWDDKPFVRKLAAVIEAAGGSVWVDEVQARIGDRLPAVIEAAIREATHFAVVLSPRSRTSEWVRREIAYATALEQSGGSPRVIPVLLRGAEIPQELAGLYYADFRSEDRREAEFRKLLVHLGLHVAEADPNNRLEQLTSKHRLLAVALEELGGDGIKTATADAITSSTIPDDDLVDFLEAVVSQLDRERLFGLALSTIDFIDKRSIGHQALTTCLTSMVLEPWQVDAVGLRMTGVTTSDAVLWCHQTFCHLIRHDGHYHTFLSKHADVLVESRSDDVLAYLLHPDRGPSELNVESFAEVLPLLHDPRPLQARWIEWINGGLFDNDDRPETEAASVAYAILNDHWHDPAFTPVAEALREHLHALLRASAGGSTRAALHHLAEIVEEAYIGSADALSELRRTGADGRARIGAALVPLEQALEATVDYVGRPDDVEAERRWNEHRAVVRSLRLSA